MAKIIVHRGGQEIGGSAIEVRAANARVLFDLGSPLDFNTREATDVTGMRESGVLPNIQGLYNDDVPTFDAIVLSHAHVDHCGLINFAHPDIPLYLSRGSKVLLDISARFLDQIGRAHV